MTYSQSILLGRLIRLLAEAGRRHEAEGKIDELREK